MADRLNQVPLQFTGGKGVIRYMVTKFCNHFFAIVFFMVLAGCNGSGVPSSSLGAISAKLVLSGVNSGANVPADVTTVRLVVTGSGMKTIQRDFPAITGSGVISGIPIGISLIVTVSALDSSGNLLYLGSVTNVTVQDGQTTDLGTISLQPLLNLATISVTPDDARIIVGATQPFTAKGTFTNMSTVDMSSAVNWNSSDTSVATIDTNGLATGISAGVTTVSATSGSVSGSVTLSVSASFIPIQLMGGAAQGHSLALNGIVATLSANQSSPAGITTDGTNLYISNTMSGTINKIVIATGVATNLAGNAGVSGSADGTGLEAQFCGPQAITTDGTNLYVSDTGNNTIRKIVIATGVVTTLAGTAGSTGTSDGDGPAAQFNTPTGITTDGTNLYIADTHNSIIRKVVIATGAVTTLAGTVGATGSDNGIGPAAQFNYPYGITTDGTSLYVADTNNFTIRKIVIATAEVTTLAGTAGSAGASDGDGPAAMFFNPSGITTDGINLYISDSGNCTIRKVVIATGTVTTLAGSTGLTGSANGTGPVARFNSPYGITTNGTSLFVSDTLDNSIRKIN